jgi:uncharacterized membrane protein (UPF0127 family)
MQVYDPLVFTYFDGWSSHSYPNPGFVATAKKTGMQSIVGYKSEMSYLKLAPKPVFITETGWDQSKLSDSVLAQNWSTAWSIWQNDTNVVSVTPFVLRGGEQFKIFSLYKENGEYSASGQSIYNLPKSIGSPKINESRDRVSTGTTPKQPDWVLPFFKNSQAVFKLENIFRVIMGLPLKQTATIKNKTILVELSQNAKQWEKGLSDRSDLGELDGMLFIFPQYHVPIFWMKDMKFPIDMIWIAGGRVVDIHQKVQLSTSDKLPTYSPSVPVDMVLETRAGWAEENSITLGDEITISD